MKFTKIAIASLALFAGIASAQVAGNPVTTGANDQSASSALLGNVNNGVASGNQGTYTAGNVAAQSISANATIQTGTVTYATVIPQDTTQKIDSTSRSAPSMSAPGLTSNGYDVCLGSVSASISGLGFGIGGGTTVTDENCVRLKNVARLSQLGLTNAAIALQLSDQASAMAAKNSSPELYLAMMKDKLAQLEAEFEVMTEDGEVTDMAKDALAKVRKEVRALQKRVDAKVATVSVVK